MLLKVRVAGAWSWKRFFALLGVVLGILVGLPLCLLGAAPVLLLPLFWLVLRDWRERRAYDRAE